MTEPAARVPSSANRRVRIVIADDHAVVRRGLAELFERQPGWSVCGEAGNGREAVALCEAHKPDVAVLDLSMPHLNGLEATRQIRAISPATEVLIFTVHQSGELVRDVLAAGARGYIHKSEVTESIIDAVASLSRHRPYFDVRISQTILDGYLKGAKLQQKAGGSLTAREKEVVQLLSEGCSNKEIARRLNIGVKTVETHRTAIMRKLGAHSVVDVLRYAVRNRLVEL
jgi:DNA-binding NarL/FixJ family response regulator